MLDSAERIGAMCDAMQERLTLTDMENEQLNLLLTRIPGGGVQYARFEGFIYGLAAAKSMTHEDAGSILAECVDAADELLRAKENQKDRPGRDHKYSVDVTNQRGISFPFDVPAMNPSDAYFQLSKRTVYKSIPDIVHVSVFSGETEERLDGQLPEREFKKTELIFSG
tara:strand:+ start:15364 stop:15867 length:504 start_codon:yes stop_codon:yes gene_type:complete